MYCCCVLERNYWISGIQGNLPSTFQTCKCFTKHWRLYGLQFELLSDAFSNQCILLQSVTLIIHCEMKLEIANRKINHSKKVPPSIVVVPPCYNDLATGLLKMEKLLGKIQTRLVVQLNLLCFTRCNNTPNVLRLHVSLCTWLISQGSVATVNKWGE